MQTIIFNAVILILIIYVILICISIIPVCLIYYDLFCLVNNTKFLSYLFIKIKMREMQEQANSDEEVVDLNKKFIIFRNPQTKEVIAEAQIPNFITLSKSQICNLQMLRSKLRMLYIDVLCRGYHPVKGFQLNARNVFQPDELFT